MLKEKRRRMATEHYKGFEINHSETTDGQGNMTHPAVASITLDFGYDSAAAAKAAIDRMIDDLTRL